MTRRLLLGLTLLLLWCRPAIADEEFSKILPTTYTIIQYSSEKEISDFLWRITGERLTESQIRSLTQNRVDELVERVLALLDMYPEQFNVIIRLKPVYQSGHVAYYSHDIRTITVHADRITDGILAHEMAHAVINAYFGTPPPAKTQEVLAQYVDQHLWLEAS